MRYLAADKWWWLFPLYLLSGLALGLVDPVFGQAVEQLGVKRGLATAASVNVLLPLVVIALGVACPRPGAAWLGAVGMTGAFLVGLAVAYPPVQPWNGMVLLRSVPPVLIVACLGYVILGTLAALVVRAAWK